MRSAAPGDERDSRPPVALPAAPTPGEAGRRSVWRRPLLTPRLHEDGLIGFPAHHPFVRRFWTAALGPGAVADLLRLMAAARGRRALPLPDHLALLARAGLVTFSGATVWVRPVVPPLGGAELRRITPALRAEHRAKLQELLSERTQPQPSAHSTLSVSAESEHGHRLPTVDRNDPPTDPGGLGGRPGRRPETGSR